MINTDCCHILAVVVEFGRIMQHQNRYITASQPFPCGPIQMAVSSVRSFARALLNRAITVPRGQPKTLAIS